MARVLSKPSTASDERRTPPGPGPLGYLRTQIDFSTGDQVEFVRDLHAEWGDSAAIWLGAFRTYFFANPEHIEEVLIRKASSFEKDAITPELSELMGQGLVTSEGELWRRQRKLAAPALTRRQIEAYADWMVELTENELADWQDGQEIELHHAMMAMTLKIVVKTLFNIDMGEEVERIGEAVDEAMEVFDKKVHTLWRFVPDFIPTHLDRRFDRAVGYLDDTIYDLIRKRRASDEEGDDLLYRLLIANDDDGSGMTDQQLRDEAITMFLAGHETTALVLTYAWYLMSHEPEVARRLFEEVDEVLGDRSATANDVGELDYTTAVVKETMRLYSPVWLIGREAMEDVQIGPYDVPKGTQVLLPQCVVHRDERWYDDPGEFQPERWLDPEFEKSLPRFAYFPFGGGARICIGNHFAKMEAVLCLATMAQRFDFENLMTRPIETRPAVTMRPVVPVPMKLHSR